ncbi:pancreatic triacylglycerol lipase [Trichonephila clavipes]|uniref:Pancreatic triacylglycerol lipase n=1 Tax=Trichonephila clavipes TaxID=2585209 RepID=A0A8X6SM78_TRICX|nr:pancreatic triacylglycerol lipase [Trichonephila clavipes]
MTRRVQMLKRSVFIVFVLCILWGEIAESQILFSKCYPDTKQKCDVESADGLPWETKIRFFLFTRKNSKEPEHLHLCNGTLPKDSRFNPKNRLYVFIPGYKFGVCELEMIPIVKEELLERGDYNVLLMDCTDEYGTDFIDSMQHTKKASTTIARVLKNIQAKTGLKNEDVYLIGHSLGTHVAGMVGQIFKVKRITALDPAGVTYTKELPLDQRLDVSDAEIVDAIHTNGGKGLPYLGLSFPIGHFDFYVNGGILQPSCSHSIWDGIKNFNVLYVVGVSLVPSLCAHMQAVEYYKITINNRHGKFIGVPCNSYRSFKSNNCTVSGPNVTMGFDLEESLTPEVISKEPPRKYYLDTTSTYPYVK